MVELDHLTKRFVGTVVDYITVDFRSGQLTTLLGPSGCGKSTLLYMLAGIVPVSDGTIRFDHDDVTALPDKRGVGLVFQNYALYPHLSVLDNIAFPLTIQKLSRAERRERVMATARVRARRRPPGTQTGAALGRPTAAGGDRPGTREADRVCCCSTSR